MFLAEDRIAEGRYWDASTRNFAHALGFAPAPEPHQSRCSPNAKTSAAITPNSTFRCLDCRFLAGDAQLFSRLRHDALPQMIVRDRSLLLQDISGLTRQRHEKEGDTIFHLEPNLKNSPGGLRDYHVASWVTLITQDDPRNTRATTPESLWPPKVRDEMNKAFDFLAAARCFLHFRQGRDDNRLSYELQAEAALRGIGGAPGRSVDHRPIGCANISAMRASSMAYPPKLLDEALPVAPLPPQPPEQLDIARSPIRFHRDRRPPAPALAYCAARSRPADGPV